MKISQGFLCGGCLLLCTLFREQMRSGGFGFVAGDGRGRMVNEPLGERLMFTSGAEECGFKHDGGNGEEDQAFWRFFDQGSSAKNGSISQI